MSVAKQFEITQNRRVFYGEGAISNVSKLFDPGVKVFVLTYSKSAAITASIEAELKNAGIAYTVSDRVQTEPDLFAIDETVAAIKEAGAGAILAIGGGSVLDAGKAAAMIAANGGVAEDYQMRGKVFEKRPIPLVMVPTTAGTGSEATKVAVIYNNNNHLKKSIYSPWMVADAVILDPVATAALPPAVTAATGIDALSHAIESFVSLDANVYTEMYSLQAMRIVYKSLAKAVADGADMEARADMLYASYYAGVALHAGIGLAHIIAQPIGGLFKIPHGDACSIFLPHAMEYNLGHAAQKYCQVATALGGDGSPSGAIRAVNAIIKAAGAPTKLGPYLEGKNFKIDDAVTTIFGATGHIKCNPRPVDAEIIKITILKTI